MDGQQSEFKSQYVAPKERKGAPTTWGSRKVTFEGNTTYQGNYKPIQLDTLERGAGPRSKAEGVSNKLSWEMAAIQDEAQRGMGQLPVEVQDQEFKITRRNRCAPVQQRYTSPKDKPTGVTISRSSYTPFEESVVMDSRKNRFPEENLTTQPLPRELENCNKVTCTRASYVDHGPIPKTKPVVPVKFAGDGRVFTTSKRSQYRDAYNDHQTVEVHRTKPKVYTPTKAKFRDETTNRLCYQPCLDRSRTINGPQVHHKGPDERTGTSAQLPLAKSTTYISNYFRRDVQPRQREHRVTPTEAVVKIKFQGKSNTQISYVPHPKELYLS